MPIAALHSTQCPSMQGRPRTTPGTQPPVLRVSEPCIRLYTRRVCCVHTCRSMVPAPDVRVRLRAGARGLRSPGHGIVTHCPLAPHCCKHKSMQTLSSRSLSKPLFRGSCRGPPPAPRVAGGLAGDASGGDKRGCGQNAGVQGAHLQEPWQRAPFGQLVAFQTG